MAIEPTGEELHTCAEELLYLLGAHGVEVLFLNPGTDSAPVQEAAAALAERGVPAPRVVTSTFEGVALAAAHGYWQVTRRPQAVWVHVDAGTQNLGAMVHNLFRDRAGAVVLAGKTPYGEDAGTPGARSAGIHWWQDVPDQPGIVRSYAKWASELVRSTDTARVVGRAVQVAGGGEPGLAYLTVSRDVLMEEAGPALLRRISGWARPHPAGMAPAALAEVADALAEARRPVLVTSRLGRTPGGAEALARLADVAAIPVVGGTREAVNLVSDHPMQRDDPKETRQLLAEADLILLLEVDVPWIPRSWTPPEGATVVTIGPDPLRASIPLWTFPVDVAVTADGATAVGQLADALAGRGPEAAAAFDERRRRLGPRPEPSGRAEGGSAPGGSHPEGRSLDAATLAQALDQLLEPEDLVVEETVTNGGAVGRWLSRTRPGTLFTCGGSGLGWSLGASAGVKLAAPRRRVVTLVGDGAFLFGVPTSAFALAAEAEAPYLCVVLDNDGYKASRLPVFDLFPEGVSAAAGDAVGTRFRTPPDYAAVARACGGWGDTVSDPSQLAAVLASGMKAVEAGQVAVVHARLPRD